MRIAIANWNRRRIGGIESYLSALIPELSQLGHDVAFYSEFDEPEQRAQIQLPENSPAWCAAEIGTEPSLSALRDWRPDIVYCHKTSNPDLERRLIDIAPSVFFAHDHDGTCISGSRTLKFPNIESCHRIFGRQCLLQYFPRRSGGLNPATMLKSYRDQSQRLENMKAYRAILTHSDYMLDKLQKHGLTGYRAYKNGSRSPTITSREKNSLARDQKNRAVTLVFAGR